jgi:uncharacterized small protein (DUF1192 family)
VDWDDVRPAPKLGPSLGEPLDRLGISELRARIELLKVEIARVEVELHKKQAHEAAAANLFKS